jgi:hypothetical protein
VAAEALSAGGQSGSGAADSLGLLTRSTNACSKAFQGSTGGSGESVCSLGGGTCTGLPADASPSVHISRRASAWPRALCSSTFIVLSACRLRQS